MARHTVAVGVALVLWMSAARTASADIDCSKFEHFFAAENQTLEGKPPSCEVARGDGGGGSSGGDAQQPPQWKCRGSKIPVDHSDPAKSQEEDGCWDDKELNAQETQARKDACESTRAAMVRSCMNVPLNQKQTCQAHAGAVYAVCSHPGGRSGSSASGDAGPPSGPRSRPASTDAPHSAPKPISAAAANSMYQYQRNLVSCRAYTNPVVRTECEEYAAQLMKSSEVTALHRVPSK